MKKLVIAIDCDDVLVATTPFFVDAYNATYGTTIALEDAMDESEELWNAPRAVLYERLAAIAETSEYALLGLAEEEVAILSTVSKQHSLHLVTARKPEERTRTQAMLDREVPGIFTSLDFVGWEGSKGQVCTAIAADILIDDRVEHLQDAIKCGMPKEHVILFGDYPWNEYTSEKVGDMKRCRNWVEVQERVNEIANS